MGPYRATMDDLVARVRRYIGDPIPATGTPQFSNLEIMNVLDEHRFTVRYAPLRPGPTLQAGALYNFLDYYADVGNWEADVKLSWVDFSTLTPTTSEPIDGHWAFTMSPPGEYPPVYITGKYYDLHAAAADLLEQWAATLATTAYNFSADGRSFQRGTIVQTLANLARSHRNQAMATSHQAIRSDLAGTHPAFSLGSGGPGDVTGDGEA